MAGSTERTEVIERAIEAWNRRDSEAVYMLFHPDVEYVNAPTAVEPGTRRGIDALVEVMRKQWEAIPDGQQQLVRVHEHGEEVICEAVLSRSMPGSDRRIETRVLSSWRVRDQGVTRLEILGAGPDFQEAAPIGRHRHGLNGSRRRAPSDQSGARGRFLRSLGRIRSPAAMMIAAPARATKIA